MRSYGERRGGHLTVDHYRPKNHGGNDDPANLVYACIRCNQHKASYWSRESAAISLWNPREEPLSAHLFELDDGRLLALTETGRETTRRLRLNRSPLVQARLKKRQSQTRSALIARVAELTFQLGRAQAERANLAAEENGLLEEQRRILDALWALEE